MAKKPKTGARAQSTGAAARRRFSVPPPPRSVSDGLAQEMERRGTLLAQQMGNIWFLGLFVGVIALVLYMAWPFLTSIILALILAGTFHPLMRFFTDRLRLGRSISAGLVCVVILLVVFVPLVYIMIQLIGEVATAYEKASAGLTRESIQNFFFGNTYASRFGRRIFGLLNMKYTMAQVQDLILTMVQTISTRAFDYLNSFVSNLLYFFFRLFIMLVVIFGVLQQGPALKRFVWAVSPLPAEEERLLVDRFNQMNFVTIVGNGLSGLIQGILAGIGFWVAGFDSVILWSVIMILLAFIPLIGTSAVYVPASVYLVIIGHYGAAIGLFLYCMGVSFFIDNWFKPRFMGSRVSVNSLALFLAIIGGLSVFGMVGIFYGPLVLIMFLTLVELYRKKFERHLRQLE